MRPLVIFLCIALPFIASSQSNFQPGFIVKTNGDTVKGFIETGNEKKLFSLVPFKTNLQAKEEKFTPAEVTAFGFTNGNTFYKLSYTPPGLTDTVTFAKNLLTGYYSLYFFMRGETRFFMLKTRQDSTFLLYDANYSAFGTTVEDGNYKNLLSFLSRNCPNLKSKIERLILSERDMMAFVTEFNTCADPSSVTKKNYIKPKTEFRVYAYAGGMIAGKDKYEYTGRIVGRFNLASIDKRTFLNVGVNYMVNQGSSEKTDYLGLRTGKDQTTHVGVPLTLQYNFLSGIIQPYVNAGVYLVSEREKLIDNRLGTIQSSSSFSPSFIVGAGIECPVTHNLMIKVDYSYDTFSHYPTVGVAYFFN